MAEIIKMAIVADTQLFEKLVRIAPCLIESRFQSPREVGIQVIADAAKRMLEALRPNLYEDRTFQRTVDFGHTFSPMIEAESDFEIPHGEAVAIDVALSTHIAYHLAWLEKSTCDGIVSLLHDAKLPVWTESLTLESCRHAMREVSRHRGGDVNLVLPTGIGRTKFVRQGDEIPDAVLTAALDDLRRQHLAATNRPIGIRPTGNGHGGFRGNHRGNGLDRRSNGAACVSAKQRLQAIKKNHLVLDVGGTSIRTALYDVQTNQIEHRARCPTPNHLIYSSDSFVTLQTRLMSAIKTAAEQTLQGRSPDVVSMAFAGPIDANGFVLAAPTVWGQTMNQPVDLRPELQRLWPEANPIVINDVAAAGYRFLRHPTDDLVVITVGSGIGNKTFLDGRPYTGRNGRGGEIGHIQVDSSSTAPVCECGGRGHLGAIASGRGALNVARRLANEQSDRFRNSIAGIACGGEPDRLSNEQLVAGFRQSDQWTCDVIRTVAKPLARVITTIHLNLGIERFVIYGGFGLALGPSYRDLLVEAATKGSWSVGQDWDQMIELGATGRRLWPYRCRKSSGVVCRCLAIGETSPSKLKFRWADCESYALQLSSTVWKQAGRAGVPSLAECCPMGNTSCRRRSMALKPIFRGICRPNIVSV